jgi:hypothetical protein
VSKEEGSGQKREREKKKKRGGGLKGNRDKKIINSSELQ